MAGHSGNQTNRQGGVGAVSSGEFVPVLPDRVDLPFVTESVEERDGSHPSPAPKSVNISTLTIAVPYFPDRRWSAEWRAWFALSEYARTPWNCIDVPGWKSPLEPDTAHGHLKSEIEELVEAARDERSDALGEIVAQHDEFASYFFALLTAEPALYPATNLLINIASVVATFTVLYYKNGPKDEKGVQIYPARPRPSHVCPALLPPVPVPGHPSYPSGHATEAHLIALVLTEVFSAASPDRKKAMESDLQALAHRISRNREIAGLHYPSDSRAGKHLAARIHAILANSSHGCVTYLDAVRDARCEWGLR